MAYASLRHLLGLFILAVQSRCVTNAEDAPKPNFILMMVDDLGIGDVGCYGNDTIRTPNIDRLAKDGVKLTQHVAAAPLCTPSRTAFMTGRYALRSGLGSTGRVQVILFLGASGGLPPNETTFAKLLQKQGYTTGIVGKWHLGMSCKSRNDHCHHPNNHGFDYFYGLPFTLFNDCKPGNSSDVLVDLQELLWHIFILLVLAVLTLITAKITGILEISSRMLVFLVILYVLGFLTWYVPFAFLRTWNCIIMRNQDVVEQPLNLDTLTEKLMKEAEQFVERNQNRPFLLFLSLPHVHTPLFITKQFAGKSKHGLYGDNVEEVDWMIGRMMKTVEKLNLSERTLMYFTSDHGGDVWVSDSQGHNGGWNGIYRDENIPNPKSERDCQLSICVQMEEHLEVSPEVILHGYPNTGQHDLSLTQEFTIHLHQEKRRYQFCRESWPRKKQYDSIDSSQTALALGWISASVSASYSIDYHPQEGVFIISYSQVRGKTMGGWEGGIRVPGIFRWTNHLPAGKIVNEPTSLMDIFPTVVSLAGGQLPNDRILDGHDLLPLLFGKTKRSKHEFMFHYCGVYLNAVRWHPPDSDSVFKVHFFSANCNGTQTCLCHGDIITHHDPPLVFDVTSDPSEATPLTAETEARYGEVLRRVRDAVQEHQRTLTLPENQLSWPNVLWKPWLQPCCGIFPFCSCSET